MYDFKILTNACQRKINSASLVLRLENKFHRFPLIFGPVYRNIYIDICKHEDRWKKTDLANDFFNFINRYLQSRHKISSEIFLDVWKMSFKPFILHFFFITLLSGDK